MLAKLNVQVTDLGYAQIVEHLGKVCHNNKFFIGTPGNSTGAFDLMQKIGSEKSIVR